MTNFYDLQGICTFHSDLYLRQMKAIFFFINFVITHAVDYYIFIKGTVMQIEKTLMSSRLERCFKSILKIPQSNYL